MKADKKLTGKVIQKNLSKGSKSERQAVCLETQDGTYILRRKDGNPLYDEELNKLIGKQITSTGIVADQIFIANKIVEI